MPKKTLLLLALVCLAAVLALAACNRGDDDDGNGTDDGATATPGSVESPTPVPSPPLELCPTIDGEVVQAVFAALELEETEYQRGEPVEMTLRLTNCASAPITRIFQTEQRYEFTVFNEDGEEIWRWSEGMEFANTQDEQTFQPNEQQTFVEVWDQTDNAGEPVEPGLYQISVESTGCDESLQDCGPLAARFIEITAP